MESDRNMDASCIRSLESASTTKPSQNNIDKEKLCDKSTAHSDCPLSKNGSSLTPESPIHVTYRNEVSNKPSGGSKCSTVIHSEKLSTYIRRFPKHSNKHTVGASAPLGSMDIGNTLFKGNSKSFGSLDDGNTLFKGALPTPIVWEERLQFQKSWSYIESWVNTTHKYMKKTQRKLSSGACDEVRQKHGCVLYPQSLECASTTKLLEIEPNQNNIHKEKLCNKSNACSDCPLSENGSISTLDSSIQVIYQKVLDKPLVNKTQSETINQAKLLKSDGLASHLSKENLNDSNNEQPPFDSTSSSSSRSLSIIYPYRLRSDCFEHMDNISECCTLILSENISSFILRSYNPSYKHTVESSASFGSLDGGNSLFKESSQKQEHSNDASISSPCKKQNLTEERGAQVLSAMSEGSISASCLLIDFDTPNFKNTNIDTKKMPLTDILTMPECQLNVTLPSSDHLDVVSVKENSSLISKHSDRNKCPLERDDTHIHFLKEQVINSDLICSKNDPASKCMNTHTDKIEYLSELKCPPVGLDREIARVNESVNIFKLTRCLSPNKITGPPIKHDKRLETNNFLMTFFDNSICSKSTLSHEISPFCSYTLKNQNQLIIPSTKESLTLEKNPILQDFNRNDKHNSSLSLTGEKKSKEVSSDQNSSSRSKCSSDASKTSDTLNRNIGDGKRIHTSIVCEISKENISKARNENSLSRNCRKKLCFDGSTGESMIDKTKSLGLLSYMNNRHRYVHETHDKDKASNIPRRKKEFSLAKDILREKSETKPAKTTEKNFSSLSVESHKSIKCNILTSDSHRKEIMSHSTEQMISSDKTANVTKKDDKIAENSEKNGNSSKKRFYGPALQSEIFWDENCHTLEDDSTLHSSSKKHILSLFNRNDSSKRTHLPGCSKSNEMPETNTWETRRVLNSNIIPCDVKKRDCSPKHTKESISNRKLIMPFECQSFTHQYAIDEKPLKRNHSKLRKLRNNSKDKVTDQMSKKSNVCSENKIVTKHTNWLSDSGLYLFNESEQFIDKGEKQPNKQRGPTDEEGEKNDCKIS